GRGAVVHAVLWRQRGYLLVLPGLSADRHAPNIGDWAWRKPAEAGVLILSLSMDEDTRPHTSTSSA
ncbi:MAG: hypothetical protein O6909_04705, partial [Alphaproteobacteria bacterium]|nr:hypothetical protein [Alphaproteobacteria bacterium]